MNKTRQTLVLIYGLMALVILSRLLPHPPNFTPVAALGLFAGAYLSRKIAWLLPLLALFISDLFLGIYEPLAMLFVYLGFAAAIAIGHLLLQQQRHALPLAISSVAVATLFFLLSNFGTWLAGGLYPLTLNGLVQCYVLALPFFGNTLASTVLYTFILFTLFEWLQQRHTDSAVSNA